MEILNKILNARDNRAFMRKKIAETGCISLSLSLNIPGFPKSNQIYSAFFNFIIIELKRWLSANRIFIEESKEIKMIDEAGDFYLVPVLSKDSIKIKTITEKYEESHVLGRFIDIDITDSDFSPVSSGKAKVCFFCEKQAAITCMREKKHDYNEIREFQQQKINEFFRIKRQEMICRKLSEFALKAILYEISLTPKPGLVDKISSGSHTDMDYTTFINSSAAISTYFYDIANVGFVFMDSDFTHALAIIRNIGLKMEQEMFRATNQINTQKGIIFLLGLALFSAGYLFSNQNQIDVYQIQNTVKKICKNMVSNELQKSNSHQTHGEISFSKYQNGGARAEAEQGFPTIFNYALPELNKHDSLNNFALTQTLLAVMKENQDSNVLYRKNMQVLQKMQQLSKLAFEKPEHENYRHLCNYCLSENISPGGSADLLAVTIFIRLVHEYRFYDFT